MINGAIRPSQDRFRIIAVIEIPLRTVTEGIIKFAEESHVLGKLVFKIVFRQPGGAFVESGIRLLCSIDSIFHGTGDLQLIEPIAGTHTYCLSIKFSVGLMIPERA